MGKRSQKKASKAENEVNGGVKIDVAPGTEAPVKVKKSKKSKKIEETPAAAPEPMITESTETTSKKRKAELDEIAVDLNLPEPPSKKAKRLLKKGKDPTALTKSKKKSAGDDDLLNIAPGETPGTVVPVAKKPRSEHAVWVGNLDFHFTTSDLRKWLVNNSGGVIFDTSITRVKMPSSKEKLTNGNRKNKGFAYVDFDSVNGKVAAIALSETQFGTRRLLIKDAISFEGRPKVEKPAEPTHGKKTDEPLDYLKLSKHERDAIKKIYIGNLPFAANEDDVYNLFDKCGVIDWVKIATFEDSGKCKGYGWVKFKEPEAAAAAVKGYALVPHDEANPEDFQTEEEIAAAKAEEEKLEAEGKAKKPKKPKMRKWHVTRLKGRDLKIELAEDNKTRYEKRFGKGSKKGDHKGGKKEVSQEAAPAGDAMDVNA